MADQVQLIFLLIIALMYDALLASEDNPRVVQFVEVRANLNNVVDKLLPSIRKTILKNGMDPMQLVDISEYIFPHLPGKLKGNIDLKKGWMQNLSQIKRSNNVTAIYKDKRLSLDMNLGFDVMDFNYEYYLQHLLYKRHGDMYGRFYKLDVNVVMSVDLLNYYLILDSIKFSDVWKYDIKFEGRLLDPILNAATKVITSIFRNQVLTVIENYAKLIFSAKLDEWNKISQPNRTALIEEWLDIVKI
ncbi:uncharacterized protein LOC105425924 [Pogonomyrmex barbatus]|uniref:Uncharacterized protein LOC105425924 n=1 Tax=Pogonomyrmex barbatus TaxID=144034 RepID=A0A6I9W0V9_9HYME|nr:uncharacterized protein LOC105425924 [Pogonomyrmex barbatus]